MTQEGGYMRTLKFTYNGWEYPVHCYPHGKGWLGWADLPLNEHGRPERVRLWIPPVGQVEVAVLEGTQAADLPSSELVLAGAV
jgi:hypothetical protein